MTCYECGNSNPFMGIPTCPKSKLNEDDEYLHVSKPVIVAFVCMHPSIVVNHNRILLNNQSSVHIVKSKSSTVNSISSPMPPYQGPIIQQSNGRIQFTNKIAEHPDIENLWFIP